MVNHIPKYENIVAYREIMHKADIKAELEKKGWTLTSLSEAHGFLPEAVSEALRRGRPSVEKIIADALDTTPQNLFPNRFNADSSRKDKRTLKGKSHKSESNTKNRTHKGLEVAGCA